MKTYRPILVLILCAICAVAFFIWSSWHDRLRAEDTQRWINHTNDVIKELDDIQTLVTAEESAVRGYVITGDSIFLADLSSTNKTVADRTNHIAGIIADNKPQLEKLQQLKQYIAEKLTFQRQIVEARQASPPASLQLIASLKGKSMMDQVTHTIVVMKDEENRLLKERTIKNQEASQKSLRTSIVGAILVLIFSIILLLRLNRDIQLRHKTEELLQKSEAQYRQFVENAGVINYTSNVSGIFTFISQQVITLTGYAPEELVGKHFSILLSPDWVPKVAESYQQQFTSRKRETSLTFPILHKNGETRWVQQDAILLEKDNMVQGFQCVVKDVTEQTIAQKQVEKMEEEKKEYQYRIQAMLDNAPLIIYVKDLDGRYILINRQFTQTFGLADEQVLGKKVVDMEGNRHATERYISADKQVIETGKPVELEDVLSTANGDRHLLTIKFPLFDKNNKVFGISGFMKDITDMVKYRHELIAARQKAESAEVLQEQFLANMSHEIRTPMNGIVGMTGLLMQTPLQPQQQEYVQIVKQSSDNLLVLINDILDLSKIKAGKISIEKIPFSLDDVIKPLNAAFRLKAAEKELGFSILLHPSVPLFLFGDPHRLGQVISNLLSNAMKFTEKGYVTMEINVQQEDKEQVTLGFQVSDSGIGIDEKQLPLIFESFSQASADTTRRFGGTGLGLAITKRLIELQHGSIHVTSKAGIGTTFTILLPFRVSSEEEVMKGKVKHAAQPEVLQNYQGKHVLIVEDNEVNQRVLQYNLEQYNLTVAVVNNGREAIQWLNKNKTDLIMMDLHMPLMDGLQATDYIRRQLKSTIPIIILTASVLRNERQRCLNIGANDYIAKPFAREELQRSLGRYLSGEEGVQGDYLQATRLQMKESAFDLSALLNLKDADAIREIYTVFEKTVPSWLEELKQLAIREDWNAVFEMAHKLKGSLGIIQVKDLLTKMAAIEANAKTRKEVREILPMINESIATYYHISPMIKLEIEKEIV